MSKMIFIIFMKKLYLSLESGLLEIGSKENHLYVTLESIQEVCLLVVFEGNSECLNSL